MARAQTTASCLEYVPTSPAFKPKSVLGAQWDIKTCQTSITSAFLMNSKGVKYE